jgi:hypothetical protein
MWLSPFLVGHRVGFLKGHYFNCFFNELGFVAIVGTSNFLLDFHLLLLEVIGVSNLGPFPFHAHLKSSQELHY